jgi:hypothetical protein
MVDVIGLTLPWWARDESDELGQIALLVIRARSRWRELKGVGG